MDLKHTNANHTNACQCHQCRDEPPRHAAGGGPLSKEEAIEFLTRRIYLGGPKVRESKPGKRGPKFRKTQYDEARESRLDLYRKLVKLPRIGMLARHPKIHDDEIIKQEIVKQLEKGTKRGFAKRVQTELKNKNFPIPDVSTIIKLSKEI